MQNQKKVAFVIEASTRANGATQKYISELKSAQPDWDFQQVSLRETQLPLFVDHRVDGNWDFAKLTLPLLEKMVLADLIIFATPLYWYSVSHLMKNFMDYFSYFMRANKTPSSYFLENKKVLSLIVGSHEVGNEWAFGSLRQSVQYLRGNMVKEFFGIADRQGNPDPHSIEKIKQIRLSDL